MIDLSQKCEISILLAYGMLAYIMASIYYFIFTRTVGTPFYDSLTDAQRAIKNKSAGKRKSIFYTGILISIGALFYLRPFNDCIE